VRRMSELLPPLSEVLWVIGERLGKGELLDENEASHVRRTEEAFQVRCAVKQQMRSLWMTQPNRPNRPVFINMHPTILPLISHVTKSIEIIEWTCQCR